MITVIYFTGSGHSQAVAEWMADKLSCKATAQESLGNPVENVTTVVVFPVYCQNVPPPVVAFLKQLRAPHVGLIATYGGFSHGNVLWEAQRILGERVIFGAYLPTGHSCLGEPATFDTIALEPLLQRCESPSAAIMPRTPKNPLADLAPAWRSRTGIRMMRTETCDGCGLCTRLCPMGAMRNGISSRKCIRCLRCVSNCPRQALIIKNTLPMRLYFQKPRKAKRTRPEIYL